jgi:hypothetical protein
MTLAHEQLSLDSSQDPLLIPVNTRVENRHMDSIEIKARSEQRQKTLRDLGFYSVREKVIIIANRVRVTNGIEIPSVD